MYNCIITDGEPLRHILKLSAIQKYGLRLHVKLQHRRLLTIEQATTFSGSSLLPDDDWQEEHKRLAGLDDGLGGGLGLEIGGESVLAGAEESSSTYVSSAANYLLPTLSIPSLNLSSSSGLPRPG